MRRIQGRFWRRRGLPALVVLLVAACLAGAVAFRVHAEQTADAGLRRLFRVQLPNTADGVPAYLAHVATPSGTRDLLFLTTQDGHILAVTANNGTKVWERQYGAGACRINQGDTPCYTTSSPAVDPNGHYVYTYGLDGAVHKLRVGDGTEVMGGGWPETATRKGFDEKGSSALAVVTARDGTHYLYVANGGYPGDRGDYQGHLTTIDLGTGAQHVFNATCSNLAVHFVEKPGTPDCPYLQTAIWARPAAVYDRDTDRVYVATGNGEFDPHSHAWGESVLALHADGTGVHGDPLDSYTPANFGHLNDADADLGSSEPAILPMPAASRYRHVGLQAGKDALLRLLNLDHLNGGNTPGKTGGEIGNPITVPQGEPVLTNPAIWVDPKDRSVWAFVANGAGISGLRLQVNRGTPSLVRVWKRGGTGTSPLVANGILFYAGSSNFWALDPRTGGVVGHDSSIGPIHWESPRAVGNTVYITDSSAHLSAFAIPRA